MGGISSECTHQIMPHDSHVRISSPKPVLTIASMPRSSRGTRPSPNPSHTDLIPADTGSLYPSDIVLTHPGPCSISLGHQNPEQHCTHHHPGTHHKTDPSHSKRIRSHSQTQKHKRQTDKQHQPHATSQHDNPKDDPSFTGGSSARPAPPTLVPAIECVADMLPLKGERHRRQCCEGEG